MVDVPMCAPTSTKVEPVDAPCSRTVATACASSRSSLRCCLTKKRSSAFVGTTNTVPPNSAATYGVIVLACSKNCCRARTSGSTVTQNSVDGPGTPKACGHRPGVAGLAGDASSPRYHGRVTVTVDVRTVGNVIGGDERPAANGATFEKLAPATGELLSLVARSDASDTDAAIAAAAEAQPAWAERP